jgi:hypothetical protein
MPIAISCSLYAKAFGNRHGYDVRGSGPEILCHVGHTVRASQHRTNRRVEVLDNRRGEVLRALARILDRLLDFNNRPMGKLKPSVH